MQLDNDQLAAATTDSTKVAVMATAGSGKTRTMAARFQYMTEDMGVPSEQIATITFTRHAAREMRERIGKGLGFAYCGTFHAMCLQIIKQWGHTRGWEYDWMTLLDEKETLLDQKECLKDVGLVDKNGKFKNITETEWHKFTTAMTCGGAADPKHAHSRAMVTAWVTFQQRLRAENVLTYGTLMLEALDLLQDESVAPEIRKRYRHMILDEAQDTDSAQFGMLRALRPDSMWVTGDIDQSLYSWRGARPDLFLKFAREADLFQLPNSYRFGYNIAQPASMLIKHNTDRIDMAINAIGGNEGTVKVLHDAEYTGVARVIQENIDAGIEPGEIAILGRTHRTLDFMADELAKTDIPFIKLGGKGALPLSSEFRAVKGYLRLAVNKRDRMAFSAIAAAEHVSERKIQEYRAKAATSGTPIAEVYGEKLPQTMEEIRAHLADRGERFTEAIDYAEHVMEREALADTGELVRYLALANVQDEIKTKPEVVTLSTVHSSKGLEWKVVVVLGLNAKQFPSPKSMKQGGLQEERCCLFVAMTRAMEKLYMVSTVPERKGDGPSMFLEEIQDKGESA